MPTPIPTLIEAAIETPDDALAAEAGGAERLELCSALDLGGLTPSFGNYVEVRSTCRLPVVVMIRPRPGDFVYSDAEFRVMLHDITAFKDHKPAAFVFGILRSSGHVDADRCADLVRAAGGVRCVFHRAFDRAPSAADAIEVLVKLRFLRLLTSGGETAALTGSPAIEKLVKLADGRIQIMPCGRVRADSAAEVVRLTGCDQIHGSFALPVATPEGMGHRGYQGLCRTSRDEIRKTREALNAFAAGEV